MVQIIAPVLIIDIIFLQISKVEGWMEPVETGKQAKSFDETRSEIIGVPRGETCWLFERPESKIQFLSISFCQNK